MDVAIDQPGKQRLPSAIEDAGAGRDFDTVVGTDGGDERILDEDRGTLQPRAGAVNQLNRPDRKGRVRAGMAALHSACNAALTSPVWPSTLTFRKTALIFPDASMTKVLRSIPQYVFPYMFLSLYTS